MKIAVLVKQVPGLESPLQLSSDDKWIDESKATFELNESDGYALEEALQIKDKSQDDTEIIAVSLGPDRVQKILRESLAKGADRAIHIHDDTPIETDPFAVACFIAAVLRNETCDLLLTGLQSEDLGMGQTGVILGELLGMSTTTLVVDIEIKERSIRVKRELESGWCQWLTLTLPASVTIQTGTNQLRYPTIKGIIGAKRKEIKVLQKSDLPNQEPLQHLQRLFVQQKTKRAAIIEEPPEQAVSRLVEVLKTEIKII